MQNKVTLSKLFPHVISRNGNYQDAKYTLRDVYCKTARYYNSICNNSIKFSALKNDFIALGTKVLEVLPEATEIYGTGFPFYGPVQPIKRLTDNFKNNPNIDAQSLAYKVLPDVDFLIIYNSNSGPYNVTPDLADRCTKPFQKSVLKPDLLNRISSKYHCYEMNDSQHDLIHDFMEKDIIHIDFLAIPSHIWKDVPNFLSFEDKEMSWLIGDIGFTCEFIKDKWGRKNIVNDYMINYLLSILNIKGGMNNDALIEDAIQKHPYSFIANRFPVAKKTVQAKWAQAIDELLKTDFVRYSIDNKTTVSKNGKMHLKDILKRRNHILTSGFDTP